MNDEQETEDLRRIAMDRTQPRPDRIEAAREYVFRVHGETLRGLADR